MGGAAIMMIIKVNSGSYDEYEQLLLKRDHYRKETAQILISYTEKIQCSLSWLL